jgi:stage V sporulation protein G
MRVTEVQIIPVKPDEGLVAFASCVLDDAHFIGSIAVYTKLSGGIRLVFPTKSVGGRQMHIHHPIHREAHEDIHRAIEEKYTGVFSGG